jgi:hypothetical protein
MGVLSRHEKPSTSVCSSDCVPLSNLLVQRQHQQVGRVQELTHGLKFSLQASQSAQSSSQANLLQVQLCGLSHADGSALDVTSVDFEAEHLRFSLLTILATVRDSEPVVMFSLSEKDSVQERPQLLRPPHQLEAS